MNCCLARPSISLGTPARFRAPPMRLFLSRTAALDTVAVYLIDFVQARVASPWVGVTHFPFAFGCARSLMHFSRTVTLPSLPNAAARTYASKAATGKVVSVIGAVVDVRFEGGESFPFRFSSSPPGNARSTNSSYALTATFLPLMITHPCVSGAPLSLSSTLVLFFAVGFLI